MPVSPEAADRFLTLMGRARPITSRKMFGGYGIYLEGTFCGVIDDDRLYFKVDPETEPLYDARGAEPWMMEGKAQPYREAQDLEDPEALGEWLDLAVASAIRRKAKKGKKG